jgi:hypothetical protein
LGRSGGRRTHFRSAEARRHRLERALQAVEGA